MTIIHTLIKWRYIMTVAQRDTNKQELHHYTGAEGKACVVYLLKAYEGSDSPTWKYEFNECDNTDHQYEDGTYEFPAYAIGVYSRGESKEMNAHAKRHTKRTGEYVVQLETFIVL